MILETYMKIRNNENYLLYLRNNSMWYKYLNRNPILFKDFEKEARNALSLNFKSRVSNTLKMVEVLENVLTSMK